MDRKFYHGELNPADLAQALVAEFNRGNLRAQVLGLSDDLAVQIATRPGAGSGGETALTVSIRKVADGIQVQSGTQQWLGTAASLGKTTLAALINPWNLLGRLDDIAQDVENLQLMERVWSTIDRTTRALGTGFEISAKLKRLVCEYCGTANSADEGSCVACGAPLGNVQIRACPHCGFILHANESRCPNCGQLIERAAASTS